VTERLLTQTGNHPCCPIALDQWQENQRVCPVAEKSDEMCCKNFFKEVDSMIFKFLWRSTEWIARNVSVNARFHGGLGVTHVKAKVKAMRLMHLIRVLKEPDKVSSVLARRWTSLKMREWFLVTPALKTVFVLNVKGFYKTALDDFKIGTDKGKEWLQDVTTAKLYAETLKLFKRKPKVESRDIHIQYSFLWSEFDLYPLDLDAREVWFKLIHQVLTVRSLMFKLRIINTSICALCRSKTESFEHLFVKCMLVQRLNSHVLSWFFGKTDFDLEDLVHPKFYGEPGGMRNAILLSEFIFVLWVTRRGIISIIKLMIRLKRLLFLILV
jgi:hypothetical protein